MRRARCQFTGTYLRLAVALSYTFLASSACNTRWSCVIVDKQIYYFFLNRISWLLLLFFIFWLR